MFAQRNSGKLPKANMFKWCPRELVYKLVLYDPSLAVEISSLCPYALAQLFQSMLNLASLDISHEDF